MEPAIEETMSKARSMEQAVSLGLMAVLILGNSMRIILRVLGFINGQMAGNTMVSGRIIRWRDMECSHGLMVENMKENI